MKGRTVIISYLIVLASATYLTTSSPALGYYYYPAYYPPSWFAGFFPITNVLAATGLILAPYFALAGIISKDRSVWVEVNRMLHTHISFPLVGGLVLLYSSFIGAAFQLILPVYVLFVFIATLISVMASRTSKSSTIPAPGVPTGSV